MFTQKLEENPESAKEVVDVLRTVLSEKLGELSIGDKNVDLDAGFVAAKLRGSQYLINININEWKDAFYIMCAPSQNSHGYGSTDPVTFDTVDITIFVYDVKTKSLINKQKLENKGCPIVFLGMIPIGKNSPESRLKPMLFEWLNNIQM